MRRGARTRKGAMSKSTYIPGNSGACAIGKQDCGTSWADGFAGPCLARISGLAYFALRSFSPFSRRLETVVHEKAVFGRLLFPGTLCGLLHGRVHMRFIIAIFTVSNAVQALLLGHCGSDQILHFAHSFVEKPSLLYSKRMNKKVFRLELSGFIPPATVSGLGQC